MQPDVQTDRQTDGQAHHTAMHPSRKASKYAAKYSQFIRVVAVCIRQGGTSTHQTNNADR